MNFVHLCLGYLLCLLCLFLLSQTILLQLQYLQFLKEAFTIITFCVQFLQFQPIKNFRPQFSIQSHDCFHYFAVFLIRFRTSPPD